MARLEVSARGLALPRNPGARAAVCDMLIFADSDVALHPHALVLAAKKLSPSDASVAACFRSYGDERLALGSVSRHKSLLHSHIHQVFDSRAATFWAGCRGIRHSACAAVGCWRGMHSAQR